MPEISYQIFTLLIHGLVVACVAWTVTHEEVFREPREYCVRRSKECKRLLERKFFYLFTCEYCFSHYVTAAFLFITNFKLIYPDWRGYLISFFAVVAIANAFMSLFGLLRQSLKDERITAKIKDIEYKEKKEFSPVVQDEPEPLETKKD